MGSGNCLERPLVACLRQCSSIALEHRVFFRVSASRPCRPGSFSSREGALGCLNSLKKLGRKGDAVPRPVSDNVIEGAQPSREAPSLQISRQWTINPLINTRPCLSTKEFLLQLINARPFFPLTCFSCVSDLVGIQPHNLLSISHPRACLKI